MVIVIFHSLKLFRLHYGPGANSKEISTSYISWG